MNGSEMKKSLSSTLNQAHSFENRTFVRSIKQQYKYKYASQIFILVFSSLFIYSPFTRYSGTNPRLYNMHGGFNLPNTLASRNTSMNNVASGGVQQNISNMASGRFGSNNIPVPLSQMSHGSSHGGYSGIINRGVMNHVGTPGYSNNTNGINGSIPGILPTSAGIGNRSAVSGLGVNPGLGNSGPRVSGSIEGMVGSGNIGRNINSGGGGGVSLSGLASRLNLSSNNGSGSLGVQGPNRLSSGVHQQASPQVLSMFGNMYPSEGGPLSQNHFQSVNSLNSMGMMSDDRSNGGSAFTLNDFPQLGSRPNSAGGSHGQIGSLRKQGLGVSHIVQQNQEFSIQSEDFPALPGFKGGSADFRMDFQQKEHLHDDGVSMQSQHFSMGRSPGFELNGMYSSHHPQQQQQQQQHTLSLLQQYQQQNQSQFRLQQIPSASQTFRDQGSKSSQTAPNQFGLLGLLSIIRMTNPDLTTLALGIDLMTLGLNLNSSGNLYKTFASPWSDEPIKGEPDFDLPDCYSAKQPPALNQGYFAKFPLQSLFYIFYSMPKDEAQIYAANELYNRGWFYHKEFQLWLIKVPNMEPLIKTSLYERGSFLAFDPNTWDTSLKENLVIQYEFVEKRPALHPQ